MDVRITLLIIVFISFQLVEGEFLFNPLPPTTEQFKTLGLKCIPGRTVISIEQKKLNDQEFESDEDGRRTHMNAQAKEETCRICVCSTEGKDEYCSKRPARNVNECIRMGAVQKNIANNMPFAHERSLAFRIRRDYIWHYDEIPYESKASCKRGASYYTNNENANNTDIDIPSDIDSLLDYSNKEICYSCVCSSDGRHAGCISRSSWYCEYYRIIREPDAARDRYRDLFQQDRPAYFRTLSYRLRRNMDEGMIAFMDVVGDDKIDSKCVPFVSEYSDCTDANLCSGCNRCLCNAEGEWKCESVFECPVEDDNSLSYRDSVSIALDVLYSELKTKKNKPQVFAPPPTPREDDLIVPDVKYYEEDFSTYISRQKRSVSPLSEENKNYTVNFIHTVDEINEDTLKGTNNAGTIKAIKVESKNIPIFSRRTGLLNPFNKTALPDFNIQLNSHDYDPHIAENKIDLDLINKDYLHNLNYTQNTKDKDLSKLVVNELKQGMETIGNKNSIPVSNITFTSENDTLTAMTFIAGNLLNKLWDMEKESSDISLDIETLKHKKINDLLDLFKEPLNIRQETFLKNALEKLSDNLNRNKNIKNVSLCETISEKDVSSTEDLVKKSSNSEKTNTTKCHKENSGKVLNEKVNKNSENDITTNVISKLSKVLSLMKKFELVQKNLTDLKYLTPDRQFQEVKTLNKQINDDNSSMHLFSNLLDKITELLIPNNGSKNFTSKLKNLNQFSDNDAGKKVLKNNFHIDIDDRNLTIKDKLLLDYLNHIESNPNCLFSHNYKKSNEKRMNIEGNILYNLSEFFKIKSLIDLVQLTKSTTSSVAPVTSTTEKMQQSPTIKGVLRDSIRTKVKDNSRNLNITKEKLKTHLRAIIDDLLELQNDNDSKSVSKINILDAMPCIYKLLNTDKVQNDPKPIKKSNAHVDPLEKIKILIDSLKIEFTTNTPTRRNILLSTERPRSAKVLERIVKNINKLQQNTRRNTKYKKSKSYNDIKATMDKVEAVGNSYKNFALLSVIPPQKRLMLLKTLEVDTKQNSLGLNSIKDFLDSTKDITLDKRNELKEFIDNVKNNIKLSAKVLNNLKDSKTTRNINNMVEVFANQDTLINKPPMDNLFKKSDLHGLNDKKFKLTRDQIMSKLIENRVKLYVASLEETGSHLNSINYNIAKRILKLLDDGNIDLAKELYNIFLNDKQAEKINDKESVTNLKQKGPLLLALKEPLIRFDEPAKGIQIKTPEMLFRQLLNIKNINE